MTVIYCPNIAGAKAPIAPVLNTPKGMKNIKLGHSLSFYMLRKVFSKQILGLSKVIWGFWVPLPRNWRFECSIHFYRIYIESFLNHDLSVLIWNFLAFSIFDSTFLCQSSLKHGFLKKSIGNEYTFVSLVKIIKEWLGL